MRDPLLGPVAAIAAGILAARFVPFRNSELILVIAAFLALGIVAIVRRARVLAGICCLLGLVAAGALTALAHRPGPAPQLDVTGREVAILSGCVVEPPALSGERERFLLELEPHARVQVTLYAKPDEALPALAYGRNIELDARVRSPRNYENPGAFDYRHYLARRDIYWTGSSAARTVHVLPGRCGAPFEKAVMDLRAAAMARINSLYGRDPYQAAMMQAVLLGQQFQMQKVWTDDYRSTGTFHTLVISGTHVAIVAAFFFFLLRVCFVPASLAGALTAAVAWLYALVTGFNAPCVRSAAALTLAIAAGYFFRERRPLNLLAAVALGFLLFDPDQLFDASFQLSFLAVAFQIAIFRPELDGNFQILHRRFRFAGQAIQSGHCVNNVVRLWRGFARAVQVLARFIPAAQVHQRHALGVMLFGGLERRNRRARNPLLADAYVHLGTVAKLLAGAFQDTFEGLLGALELLLLEVLKGLFVEFELRLLRGCVRVRRQHRGFGPAAGLYCLLFQ